MDTWAVSGIYALQFQLLAVWLAPVCPGPCTPTNPIGSLEGPRAAVSLPRGPTPSWQGMIKDCEYSIPIIFEITWSWLKLVSDLCQ